MPNLEQIKNLNLKYNKKSPITRSLKLFSINENLTVPAKEKAIQDSISELGANYTRYFDQGTATEVVLLFIDICDFSTKQSALNGKQIGTFFDEYYDIIIPIIYDNGGEIDKIIGDGIICIFGQPFLNESISSILKSADKCSKEIIKKTKGTKFSSKIAFHKGEIHYFRNKSGFYNELTIVGKPLTELFRLESISEHEAINYLVKYQTLANWNQDIINDTLWETSKPKPIPLELKGVDYKHYQTKKYRL